MSSKGEGESLLFVNTGQMSNIEVCVDLFSKLDVEGTFDWLTMGNVKRLDTSQSR